MKKVLIVDDNTVLLEQIVSFLKLFNEIEIVGTANNGESELDFIKKFSPDVVVTDVEMPQMTGIEVVEKVSAFEKVPEFIVVTGYIDSKLIEKINILPIKRVFRKPLNMEKLKNEILS